MFKTFSRKRPKALSRKGLEPEFSKWAGAVKSKVTKQFTTPRVSMEGPWEERRTLTFVEDLSLLGAVQALDRSQAVSMKQLCASFEKFSSVSRFFGFVFCFFLIINSKHLGREFFLMLIPVPRRRGMLLVIGTGWWWYVCAPPTLAMVLLYKKFRLLIFKIFCF